MFSSGVMRHLRRTLLILLVVALMVSLPGSIGCGTFIDTVGGHEVGRPRVYGGVKFHIERFAFPSKGYELPLWLLVVLVDLPLSAVMDTAMLLVTIPYQLLREDGASGAPSD